MMLMTLNFRNVLSVWRKEKFSTLTEITVTLAVLHITFVYFQLTSFLRSLSLMYSSAVINRGGRNMP